MGGSHAVERDVNLLDVNLRDVNLRDVNLRDVNLRDVKLLTKVNKRLLKSMNFELDLNGGTRDRIFFVTLVKLEIA